MSDVFQTEIYTDEQTGIEYEVNYWYDYHHGAPDLEYDGHGHIIELDFDPTDPEEVEARIQEGHSLIGEVFAMKAPLMRPLTDPRFKKTRKWFDFVTSMNIASKDWGVEPEKVYDVVEKDYEYLRGWYNDLWHWMGVTVRRADRDSPWCEVRESLGGFESTVLDNAEEKSDITKELVFILEQQIKVQKNKQQLSLTLD